jgi:hypothetical protein
MAIIRNKLVNKFTSVPNSAIVDSRISDTAFRVLSYLFSRPDGWEINNKDVMKQLCIKRGETMASKWKELLESGWVSRQSVLTKNGLKSGYFDYTINDEPMANTILPDTVECVDTILPESIQPHVTQNSTYNKTEIETKLNITNTNKEKKKGIDFDKQGFSELEVSAINEWLSYKKEIKNNYTQTGFNKVRKDLLNWKNAGHSILDIIDTSIKNGWKGLFEPKLGFSNNKKSNKTHAAIHNSNDQWKDVEIKPVDVNELPF